MTTIARVWQWSLSWPLLFRKRREIAEESRAVGWSKELQDTWKLLRAKAIETAREIDTTEELEIMECKQHIEFYSLFVCSPIDGRSWWVDVSHAHINGWKGARFDLRVATHIKLKFSEYPITTDLLNPSSYLTIVFVR